MNRSRDRQSGQRHKLVRLLRDCIVTVAFVAAATGIAELFSLWHFPETNIVVIYILSVILIARYTRGMIYGIAATLMATAAFNYYFTAPYFTLSVYDPAHLITFAIMALTALITSALTTRMLRTAQEMQEREEETRALYALTRQLSASSDLREIVSISVRAISDFLDCLAACLCFDENGLPEISYVQQKTETEQIRRESGEADDLKARLEQLHENFVAGEEFFDWPLRGAEGVLGIIRVPTECAADLSDAQLRHLRTMVESTALAMDRLRIAAARRQSQAEAGRERERANLLRAISHDLRTPLSGIIGTGEMLLDMMDHTDERYALISGICQDAEWLHALVENILSLTRIRDGRLVLDKQPEAVEEVIGVAVRAISKRAPDYEITVEMPETLLLVPMDAKLISQVLINLLDNAVQHTPAKGEIRVQVTEDREKKSAIFKVLDRGSGIAPTDLPQIFHMFYTTRTKTADAHRGVGLGLNICESIVKAHGGHINARNRTDGPGAEFCFTLPLLEDVNGQSNL